MKTIYKVLAISCLVAFVGCDKFIDVEPKGVIRRRAWPTAKTEAAPSPNSPEIR